MHIPFVVQSHHVPMASLLQLRHETSSPKHLELFDEEGNLAKAHIHPLNQQHFLSWIK